MLSKKSVALIHGLEQDLAIVILEIRFFAFVEKSSLEKEAS
jgi:hypothetical protein